MVPNELHQCDCADIRGAVRWCAAGRRASASDGVPANRYESLLWCTSPSYAGGSYADGRAPVWRVGLRFQINGRLRLHRRNLSRQRGGRKYRDGLTEDRYESNHKPHNNPGNGHGFLRPARRRNRRDVRGRWGELPDRVCDDRREWSRDILLPKLQDRLRPGYDYGRRGKRYVQHYMDLQRAEPAASCQRRSKSNDLVTFELRVSEWQCH